MQAVPLVAVTKGQSDSPCWVGFQQTTTGASRKRFSESILVSKATACHYFPLHLQNSNSSFLFPQTESSLLLKCISWGIIKLRNLSFMREKIHIYKDLEINNNKKTFFFFFVWGITFVIVYVKPDARGCFKITAGILSRLRSCKLSVRAIKYQLYRPKSLPLPRSCI